MCPELLVSLQRLLAAKWNKCTWKHFYCGTHFPFIWIRVATEAIHPGQSWTYNSSCPEEPNSSTL